MNSLYSELIVFAVIALIITVAVIVVQSGKKSDGETGSAEKDKAEIEKLPPDRKRK